MADVTLDPQNSNPKELFGQGVRAYVLQDYETAVRALSKASELLATEHGNDTDDSLGDVYLYYGKALLELSRKESGPLGDGVLKAVEEESGEEDIGENEEEEEEELKAEEAGETNGDVNKTDDEKIEDAKPSEEEEESKSDQVEKEGKSDQVEKEGKSDQVEKEGKSSEEGKESNSGEEEKPVEEEAGSSEEKKEDDAEEELSDLQVAWEVLELAKSIFIHRGIEGNKNLAETLIVLGEISLESGNFTAAIEDIVRGLELQKSLFGNDSRTIAETYYKLGGAYSTNGQIDEAIDSFNNSNKYLQNKVNTLKKDEEHKETNAEEVEELTNLIPEIQEKIADMKNLKAEIAKKVVASADETVPKTNGTTEASSSKQANDISHLVKRKRKEEEPQEENAAKRPSP